MTRRTVICDLDGTLASNLWRQRFVTSAPKDWTTFFLLARFDAPIPDTLARLRSEAATFDICIVTGRPADYRDLTESWLAKHSVPYSELLMRPSTDWESDHVTKRGIHSKHLERRDIAYALDDRDDTIALWRELGIQVHKVRDPGVAPILTPAKLD